jgi:CRISPR/Cas system-associated endonuclease Cas1
LADTGRRVFLAEFFSRLRQRLFYPPRQGDYELRDVAREQIYHLARVVRGEEESYTAFVPS